jgi:multidrug efflux pump subunit AcrB
VQARSVAQTTLEATLGNVNTPAVWVDAANGQSYYVVTAYDRSAIDDPARLGEIPLRAVSGEGAVTLGAYSEVTRSTGAVAIERNQLQRAAHVMAQTEGRDLGSAADELEQRLRRDARTKDLKVEFVGQVDLMRRTFGGLGGALGLAVMVVFMIMATQFKSVRLPLVMLFTIPVTLVGIVLALLSAGQGFSVPALMGVLMVIGIAVSNGILMVGHANERLADGLDPTAAILDAARVRFVPILMTSLATIIGLLPTALGLEHGTESNRPLALAVVGGLASSTVLSLFLVPVMFTILARAPRADAELDALEAATSPAE